ncbi:MAG: low molecular weight phosphotyrosine protein phosphatase [Haliscomenobacter sp.]|nr:low molecular weight phosphotyrosine protein phosphatase [Haliscomenobacter sp.]
MKILMVCLGNICRSPLAEGIMKTKLLERGWPWRVDSAGTGSWHIGDLPDPRSISIARKHGIDITDQRARQFTRHDYDAFDLIFAMDRQNYQDILRLAPNAQSREKVRLILEAARGQRQEVPDPYYDDQGFEQVYRMLDDACEKILLQLRPPIA